MNQEHVFTQIPDYVLDLLPRRERQRVEKHAAVCADCRQALQQESHIGSTVRHTILAATQPDRARLAQLMPPPPVRRTRSFFHFIWQKQLAPVALFLLLLAGSLSLHLANKQQPLWQVPSPTMLAETATMTNAPTATGRQTEKVVPANTAVATTPQRPSLSATPAPIPTPIVAASF